MNAQNTQRARAQGVADAQLARKELYGTLGQLQERLNYAKRVDDATERFIGRLEAERRERPLVFVAGAAVAAIAVGAAVWVVARGVARRFHK